MISYGRRIRTIKTATVFVATDTILLLASASAAADTATGGGTTAERIATQDAADNILNAELASRTAHSVTRTVAMLVDSGRFGGISGPLILGTAACLATEVTVRTVATVQDGLLDRDKVEPPDRHVDAQLDRCRSEVR